MKNKNRNDAATPGGRAAGDHVARRRGRFSLEKERERERRRIGGGG